MSTASSAALRAGVSGTDKPKVSAWKNLQGLLPYLGRYKGGLALGLITLALMSIVGTLVPLATGVITDALTGSPRPFSHPVHGTTGMAGTDVLSRIAPFYEPHSRRTLLIYCLILVGAVALMRNRTGELMSRATNDLNSVRMVLGPGIMYSATTVATMVLAIALMVKLSASLTLWVLLPVPIVAVAVRHFGKVIHDLYEKIQASLATLSAKVQENLSGVRVVRAYAQENAEIRGFDEPNREYVARNVQLIRTWSMFMPSLQSLIGTSFLIVLWQGGYRFLHGQMSLGALITFYTYLGVLVWPMIALGWVTNIFQRGAASMGRLNYILNAQPQIDDSAATVPATRHIEGNIEFQNLSFTYPTTLSGNGHLGGASNAGQPVLQDISLNIPAGSTLAIVGPTGSGKTTLAALVARLWEAPAGQILIDGKPIREWPLATLRRSIGYVRIREAAEIANFDGDVMDFAKKYETVVGERGITLSGGQKQRTAIARAVIRDPRILILDDSLSAVDTQTEEKILSRLREIMQDRTTILISHRISTVRDADQIVVVKDGRIIEQGTHEELLDRGGYYADLHRKQLLEEELERA